MADAGLRIAVEGEKEFKAALASVDTAVKNNQKALKLLTEEYNQQGQGIKDLTTAEDALAKQGETLATKGKVLADSIAQQAEKVDLLDLRVEEAAKAYGEHDKRTEALRGQLLDASLALAKMTGEQEKNNQAIEANKAAQLDAQHSTAQYEQAVEALSASVAANDAEIKRLTESGKNLDAENQGLGRSSEDLAKKTENLQKKNADLAAANDKLRDAISKQREITENLAKAQATTVQRYGEGSKEAEAYRKRLADATAQLDKMEAELRQNEKAVEDNTAAIEKGGDAPKGMIEGLEKVVELTGVKIPAGIKEIIGVLDDGAIAAGGFATAMGGIVSGLAYAFKGTIDWSRDLTTASQKIGLTTEQYQRLEYAATKAGFSMSDFEKALEEVGDKVYESDEILGEWVGRMGELKYASDETKEAVAAQMKYWDDLGVSLYDNSGNLKSIYDLMFEVIDAIGKMETETQKNSAAQEIFGKKFREVNTLIETGADNLRKFAAEAEILTDEENEALNELGAEWDAFVFRASTATKRLILDIVNVKKETKSFGEIVKEILGKAILGPVGDVAVRAGKWLGTTFGVTKGYANGTDFAPGGLALVGERGPEIVSLPRGSAVYPHGTAPAGMSSTANTYNITIDAKNIREFNDIVRYAQGARVAMRRG